MNNPTVRLAGRAAVAGLTAFIVAFQASHGYSLEVVEGCGVAGVLAFAEVFTPLNRLVGFFKKNSA